jgi:hypothetical protein
MAAGPLHTTLVAGVVSTLTLDLSDPAPDARNWVQPKPRVTVLNLTGTAEVYFTTDGTAPTVGGNACYVLPAVISALDVDDATPGATSVIKLISSGTPKVSVKAA